MAKYFITGVGGFIGLELCKTLSSEGHELVGLVRNNVPPELTKYNIKIIKSDLVHTEAYCSELENSDYIVHLAGNPRFGNGPQYEKENYETTRILVNVASEKATKLKRFVFVSTIGAIDRSSNDICVESLSEESPAFPSSDYGRSKLKTELFLKESNIPYTIIRPTLVVGDKMRFESHVAVFCRQALQKSFFARINWPGVISVIHVSDFAESIKTVVNTPGAEKQIYFAAGDNISIGAILKLANPSIKQLNINLLANILRYFPRIIPFSLKALLYPALTASDAKLQSCGWQKKITAHQSVLEVLKREYARKNSDSPYTGYTLVTGAASGLGKAIADKLLSNNRKLILVDKNKLDLDKLFPEHSDILKIVADLADWEETELQLEKLDTTLGASSIDELYLCAGFGLRGELQRLSSAPQANIFRVNVLSRLQIIKKYLPDMINNQFGRIILISSSSAFQPLPYMAAYAASNAALLSLGESLAYENRKQGVETLVVCPGGMATSFQKSAGVKEIQGEKLMEPQEVADIIFKNIGKNKIVIMTAFRSFAMSMAARVLPRKITLFLWGKLMSVAR